MLVMAVMQLTVLLCVIIGNDRVPGLPRILCKRCRPANGYFDSQCIAALFSFVRRKNLFSSQCYQGEYVVDIARQLYQQYHNQFVISSLFKDLPLDEPEGGDKEIYIDAPDCTC